MTGPGTGIAPRPGPSLCDVPGLVLDELGRAGRGVVVLAVDGLSWQAAGRAWRAAELSCLTSTFPSTSATAWMSSITGASVAEHLVVGAAYRERAGGPLVDVITGKTLARPVDGRPAAREPTGPAAGTAAGPAGRTGAGPAVGMAAETAVGPAGGMADGMVGGMAGGVAGGRALAGWPTLFERAAGVADAVVAGRELDTLASPWVTALTRGARRTPASGRLTRDPQELVAGVAADVEAVIGTRRARPLLLWIYVNLDDHVHRHGYDGRAMDALGRLERHALDWARRGWHVMAWSDHGLVPATPDRELAERWARLESPELCELPGGGAGRVRWLYPRPGREGEATERLAAALDGHAQVLPATALGELGLLEPTGPVRERIGAVVAVATSPRFPIPDPRLAFEHGARSPEETLVPLARWVRSSRA